MVGLPKGRENRDSLEKCFVADIQTQKFSPTLPFLRAAIWFAQFVFKAIAPLFCLHLL